VNAIIISPVDVCLYLSVYLLCLSVYLSYVCLSPFSCLSVWLLSIYCQFFCLAICHLPICRFLSFCLSVCLPNHTSIFACPCVSLSVYVCLLDCLYTSYTSLYICCLLHSFWLYTVYLYLRPCVSLYLSDYLCIYPVPTSC
jgi:hypothetical protein